MEWSSLWRAVYISALTFSRISKLSKCPYIVEQEHFTAGGKCSFNINVICLAIPRIVIEVSLFQCCNENPILCNYVHIFETCTLIYSRYIQVMYVHIMQGIVPLSTLHNLHVAHYTIPLYILYHYIYYIYYTILYHIQFIQHPQQQILLPITNIATISRFYVDVIIFFPFFHNIYSGVSSIQ